jgi:protein-L-isoaspartate O-methyltransferase
MSIDKIYADKWQSSSKFFFDNGYYSQMAEIVKPYKTVLEIGCGVGYNDTRN